MNICFLIGKIVSEIKYNFVLDKFNYSVVKFEIKLDNSSIVKVIGHNEIADYCYKELKVNNIIHIEGMIINNGNIEIINIQN